MSRRERYRQDTRAEAKELAMAQVAAAGAASVSVNAIAKHMGMTGSALYRYFDSRDALLGELIADGYADLADKVEAAAKVEAEPAARLRAMAAAFRAWAIADPHRYLLLFGTPVPGFAAPPQTVEAAERALAAFAAVFAELPDPAVPVELDTQVAAWLAASGADVPAAAFRRALIGWTRLHGVLSLEVSGQFTMMGIDGAMVYQVELHGLLGGEGTAPS
ncbi:Transcriptional regulator, TetR family [Alloactinosynnema sp. L-07]|uniref:TetR/AcrR family transcriptional regulator n=1 Tax=Alloactinosynnema sp. L-07 TaxID=1653480 RepID=UPI00065EFDBF|nr:TetR/AcrR family transcriptional regulator [Alloactinosynnema sp. L-07]CRK60219.1 Transcriptional regulator, TetR family [Alloactinosynnema sp. L-07]